MLTFELAPMSFGKLVAIVSGLVTLAAAAGGSARFINHIETKAHADSMFVRRDSFALYQQGDAAIHQRDSLVVNAKLESMQKDIGVLVRACQHERRCP